MQVFKTENHNEARNKTLFSILMCIRRVLSYLDLVVINNSKL